jgi:hypothetical protein
MRRDSRSGGARVSASARYLRERADAERRGHALTEEADLGGEDVAEAGHEKLREPRADHAPLAHIEALAPRRLRPAA